MSKYFGEFLVEKGVITKENLVDALIHQISTTPPTCQIVFENKILSSANLFDIFRYQQDHQVDFISASKALGLWGQEVQDKVNASLEELRKPLGHILVGRGLIDLKKLTHMLDEFLSHMVVTSPKAEVAQVRPVVVEIKTESAPSNASSVSIEDLTESIQPGILQELDETFDEKKKKMIRVALSLVKDNAGIDLDVCKKLSSDITKILHGLNGQLMMLALDKLTELLGEMETHISYMQKNINTYTKELIVQDAVELTKSIDLAWALKLSILANGTERVFFQDTKTADQFGIQIQALKRS